MSDSDFKKWYGKPENKESLSAKRKDKYANDPEYREAVKAKARLYKKTQRENLGGAVTRNYKGKSVNVWRVGLVAEKVGVTLETFMHYINNNVIPLPKVGGKRRLYLDEEVALLCVFFAQNIVADGSVSFESLSPQINELRYSW